MEVIKRDGRREKIAYDKITARIEALCKNVEPKLTIDASCITQEVVSSIFSGISTESLDTLTANVCANKIQEHPDYNWLAARITVSNLHKKTASRKCIGKIAKMLYFHQEKCGRKNPLINIQTFEIITKNKDILNREIDFDRDYLSDFFSIKTLERAYLRRIKNRNPELMKGVMTLPVESATAKGRHEIEALKKEYNDFLEKGVIIERPQHMWMRVAIGIHGNNIPLAIETYHAMSLGYFTHATPTLFNAGSNFGNLSSCFLLGMHDSIEGIFKTLGDSAKISQRAGGIGVHLSGIRASGSSIRSTNGTSNGIIPWCQLLNHTALGVNQGGKRNGSIACYVEPWHADIFEFCELRLRTGTELSRARDLFLALWICDLFMKRVERDEIWSLFCPDECPGLNTCHGEEFERLYIKYESQHKFKKQVRARELWRHILTCQIETGMPYMAYKDNANHKNNQKNLGTIRSSNLCCEIFEYSDENEYATCNLASLSLPAFIETDAYDKNTQCSITRFNYGLLLRAARILTRNLNQVIDVNYYTVPETKVSNDRHRPIGIGVQGLADVFAIFKVAFGSPEARELNRKIHETIYYGCLVESVQLAKEYGRYSTFDGSPFSEGKLQFDLWGLKEDDLLMGFDWTSLKQDIMKYGTRNSLLTASMPTASTSQILCNNECFEPFTTNLYTRSTSAGNYTILNRYLVEELLDLGLWDREMQEELLYFGGSVQLIDRIPEDIKARYLTAFELPQKTIIDLSIDRAPFIDQSQSLNLFIAEPDFDRLTSCHFYAWKGGLKTGMYYLRTRPAVDPTKFGLEPDTITRIKKKYQLTETNQRKRKNEDQDEPSLKRQLTSIEHLGESSCEMCSA